MIRLLLLSTAFATATLWLLYEMAPTPGETETQEQTVTRAEAPGLAFDTAVAASPQTQPDPIIAVSRPQPQPEPVVDVVRAPVPVALAAPAPDVDTMQSLRAMTYGLLGADATARPFPTTPAPDATAAAPQQQRIASTEPLNAQPVTEVRAPLLRYTVRAGDSLSGIAFRHYGSTAAYIHVLNANADQLRSPADLRTGMVLVIPKSP